jgi:hypothetical protein
MRIMISSFPRVSIAPLLVPCRATAANHTMTRTSTVSPGGRGVNGLKAASAGPIPTLPLASRAGFNGRGRQSEMGRSAAPGHSGLFADRSRSLGFGEWGSALHMVHGITAASGALAPACGPRRGSFPLRRRRTLGAMSGRYAKELVCVFRGELPAGDGGLKGGLQGEHVTWLMTSSQRRLISPGSVWSRRAISIGFQPVSAITD